MPNWKTKYPHYYFECLQCGHKWESFMERRNCPKCQSKKWKEPKIIPSHPLLKSHGHKPRKGSVFSCIVCGKEFYLSPYYIKNRTGKYCSHNCSDIDQMTNLPQTCVICGKHFYCSKSQVVLRGRKCCSRECGNILISRRQKGEGSIFWRGGVSHPNRLIRYSTKMEEWRKQVFERDNYKCQKCGVHSKTLQAHHIHEFAYYPLLRFDINNGITLCKECHKNEKHYRKTIKKKVPTKNTKQIKRKMHLYVGINRKKSGQPQMPMVWEGWKPTSSHNQQGTRQYSEIHSG